MLDGVEVVWERVCHFKAKPCKTCGLPKSNKAHTPKKTATCQFKGSRGCATCGKFKKDPDHFGAPPSVNVFGSGDPGKYQRLKDEMEGMVTAALLPLDLPMPMESVSVQCHITFPDATDRDEGNMRGPIEKAIGDALTAGGWLTADTFYPVRRYTFDGVQPAYEKGVLRTRLLFFGSMEPPVSVITGEPVSCFDAVEPMKPVGTDPLALFG